MQLTFRLPAPGRRTVEQNEKEKGCVAHRSMFYPTPHHLARSLTGFAGLILSCASLLTAQTPAPTNQTPTQPPTPQWQYGGFVDLGYLFDFNHPANDVFRSRGTDWHVDDLYLNMAGAYIKKRTSEQSRWGAELLTRPWQSGKLYILVRSKMLDLIRPGLNASQHNRTRKTPVGCRR